jgi:excinuclease ABC subunit C
VSQAEFDAKVFVANLPELPGVYRMLDRAGQFLYVGKAKSLKKRVSSYFQRTASSPRIALMIAQVASIDITVTRSEAEALLLENNLIKRYAPKYNIVFRDDKSYPYIELTRDAYARLGFYRGTPDQRAEYFGPYPSSSAVRSSLHFLQKMFRLRTCEDSVFANRSRPCLLYQIRRCSGPCVQKIDPASYAEDVRMATLFLEGKGQEVIRALAARMEEAAASMAFERAAAIRDQIQLLGKIRDRQYVSGVPGEDLDIIVGIRQAGLLCVNLAMVRSGEHLGDKAFFPQHGEEWETGEAVGDFLRQHYAQHPAPQRILVNVDVGEDTIADLALLARRDLPVTTPRGEQARAWIGIAEKNATLAIAARRSATQVQAEKLAALSEVLHLDLPPRRIECFDVSHTQGEATISSCVVCQDGEMRRGDYRRFNIRDIAAGDDFAAIHQAVSRRYAGAAKGEAVCPDLILIDGGAGQVGAAMKALAALGLTGIPMIGIAKGEGRKPGLEKIVFPTSPSQREALQLPPDHIAFLLLQEIRDEAHRFAVAGHRAKRAKPRRESLLEGIPGVGGKRRKNLIAHFGSLAGVREATLEQLTSVPGISARLAEQIYQALH